MTTLLEYSALSAYVYNNERGVRSEINTLTLPASWQELKSTSAGFPAQSRFDSGGLGFTAGAYINAAGDIVIAYKGTDFLLDAGRRSEFIADMATNIALGLGKTSFSSQLIQAAEYYAEVKKWAIANGYSPDKISFTGHSLGGGIASVMTAWTGQSSTVFAQAPFQIAGLRTSIYLRAQAAVNRVLGTSDAAFAAFVSDPLATLNQREPRVLNRYLTGEIVQLLRSDASTINGTDTPIDIGTRPLDLGLALSLHSMNLHAAFLYDDRLRELAKTMPELVPALLDTKLYWADPNSRTKDLITTLVNDQLRHGFDQDSALKRFTTELIKLKGDDGMLAQPSIRKAAIAVAMDYFYNTAPESTTQSIFTVDANGAHFKYSDLALDATKLKSPDLLATATRQYLDTTEQAEVSLFALKGQDAWHIQIGTSGMIWTADAGFTRDVVVGGAQTDIVDGGGGTDILIGGAGADFLAGGSGKDTLLGGVGADVLNGGTGEDRLLGGVGADIYQFAAGDGADTIIDSDGQGSIMLGDKTLSSTKAVGKLNTWKDDNGVRYVFHARESETKGWLSISGGVLTDVITIDNFDLAAANSGEGYLGIQLDNTPKIALNQNTGSNLWSDTSFTLDSLAGKTSSLAEGTGKTFSIDLNQAAKAGDTLTLSLATIGDKFKAILGDRTVDADGAVITLEEGQTSVSFALVSEGDISADLSGALSVSYQGSGGESATSNSWGLNLQDAGESTNTKVGDYVAQTVVADNAIYRSAADGGWVEVVAQGGDKFVLDAQGNLVAGDTGVMVTDNVLYGSSGNDHIQGLTGNDALSGRAGNDHLEGGDGDDLIAGGTGSDKIEGGDGNDYISSSALLADGTQQYGPGDSWNRWGLPAGKTALSMGATWGIYEQSKDENVWSGMGDTNTQNTDGDSIDAGAGDDWVIASWGDDRVEGGDGDDDIDGLAGADVIEGGAGDDVLSGDGITKAGYLNSVESAAHGSDFVDGGLGDDEISGGGRSDVLYGGAGKDKIFGDSGVDSSSEFFVALADQGDDYIDGEDGDDYLEGNGGADMLYGGAGNDALKGDQDAARLSAAQAGDAASWGDDTLDGEDGDDLIWGNGGADILYGGAGNDQLVGDETGGELDVAVHGDDYLDGEDGDDVLVGGGKNDTLYGGSGNDQLLGDETEGALDAEAHGEDYLDGEDGDDQLVGGGKDDVLYGGSGNDRLWGDESSTTLEGSAQGNDYLDGEDGNDQLVGGGKDDTLIGGDGDDVLFGDDREQNVALEFQGNDVLDGGAGNDYLEGQGGDDVLLGGAGNDVLKGGVGSNTLEGGEGDDMLDADSSNNTLMGGAGSDQLVVWSGSSNALDGGEGDDQLFAMADGNTLDGGAGNDLIHAEGSNNTLLGGEGDDTLYVASGDNNTLDGGDGTDLYAFNPGFGVTHISDSGSGGNSVRFYRSYAGAGLVLGIGSLKLSFANGDELHIDGFDPEDPLNTSSVTEFIFDDRSFTLEELLALGSPDITGTPEADVLEGTALREVIRGLASDDVINGRAGNDSLYGDAGNDTLNGGSGNDTLVGGAGTDVLAGGSGDDVYVMDGDGDTIVEYSGEGTDTVRSSVNYTLGDALENLELEGEATHGTGNALDNVIVGTREDVYYTLEGGAGEDTLVGPGELRGGEGNDTLLGSQNADYLRGGTGADVMTGLGGNDVYEVDEAGDVVIEEAGGGNDGVRASLDYTLAEQVENLELQGNENLHGRGNALDNGLSGNTGDNLLEGLEGDDHLIGGGGNDTLVGGLGNDSYVVDSSGDVIVENAGEGVEYVLSSADYVLSDNVENLDLFGSATQATGNASDNVIRGISGVSSRLDGAGGNDRLSGSGELYGGDGDDVLTTGAGNDVLVGGAGADLMTGGAGADTYEVDNAGDQIVESVAGQIYTDWLGNVYTVPDIDTVDATISYTLGTNLENLNLVGADDIDGTGNDYSNVINGNTGNNILSGGLGLDTINGGEGADTLLGGGGDDVLDGGVGADLLMGGAGNDIYFVDNIDDQVVDDVVGQTFTSWYWSWTSQGWKYLSYSYTQPDYEVVNSSVSFTLGANLEQLSLRGADNINGTGNELNNQIFGNDGDNVLSGGGGSDWLDGGAGNNTLIGGSGDDSYSISSTTDVLVEDAAGGLDQVYASVDTTLAANIEDLFLEDGATVGAGNESDNTISGNDADNLLSGLDGNDTLDGGAGNDLVVGGEGNDALYGGDDNYRSDSNGVYGPLPNADTLDGGAGDDYVDGGSGNDVIDGGTGNDQLFGGGDGDGEGVAEIANRDSISGGVGNDTIDGGSDADTLLGGAGDDVIYGGDNRWTSSYYDAATGQYVEMSNDDYLDGGEGNDEIYGEEGNDTLLGGAGDDFIDGGFGNDTLVGGDGVDELFGGAGDDVYVVDGHYTTVNYFVKDDCGDLVPAQRLEWTADSVFENSGEGYDVVMSSASFTLGDNVEELRLIFDPLTASSDPQYYADLQAYGQDGTGNDLDNVIIGNELNNRLDGGLGDDTLVGGDGNDTYVVDSWDDVITELAGGGVDTVESYVDFGVDDSNLENVTLLGDAEWAGGSDSDNVLVGNDYGNELDGYGGNDKLVGGVGDDWLAGGGGDDLYVFQRGDGADVIDDWQGSDALHFGSDMTLADISASRDGDDLVLSVINSDDSVTVRNWFDDPEGLSRIVFCDGSALDRAGISALFNAPPLANDDSVVTDEDTAQTVISADMLLDNDTNPDFVNGDVLTIVGVSQADSGAAVSLIDGNVQYDIGDLFQSLAEGQTATDTFSYTVSDSVGATSTATVTMTIVGVNDAPVTQDEAVSVREDLQIAASGNVLANDSDIDQGTVLSVGNPGALQGTYGSLVLNEDGSYVYTLDNSSSLVQSLAEGQTVMETFAYQASDGIAQTLATLSVSITGSNDAPLAVADTGVVGEDAVIVISGNVLVNDSDIDSGTALRVAAPGTYTGQYGTLELAQDGSYVYALENSSLRVQSLAAGQSVTESFAYEASDGIAQTSATLSVSITGSNDAPVVVADANSAREDAVITMNGNVLANDSDIDQGAVLGVGNPGAQQGVYGSLVLSADGSYVYTLDNNSLAVQALVEGQVVTETFAYQASDGLSSSASNLTIRITGANDAPVVVADANAVGEDSVISVGGNVLANDSDIDSGTTLTVAAPGTYAGQYGTLVLMSNGAYTYTLNKASTAVQSLAQGATVSDVFTYSASDGLSGVASSLTISITGTNDAPVLAVPVPDQSATAGTNFSYQVSATAFTDIDAGDLLSYGALLSTGQPLPTWLTFDASTRTFSGTPAATDVGSLSINVIATDKWGATAMDTFLINVAFGPLSGGTGCDKLTGGNGDDDMRGLDGDDTLIGGGGADRLDGGNGSDSLCGGAGNDTYIVDCIGDTVLENAGEGADTVQTSITYTLGANLENLTLMGTSAINGYGNSLDNVLIGNTANNTLYGYAGNDVLSGGAGADKLYGGTGNDIYVVDNTGDLVSESANEGTDTVQSSITYTLGNNAENLTLTGTSAINGTGNSLSNVLAGNGASNVLTAGAGNDTLNGGAGSDTLAGGTGNDTYWMARGYGADTIQENDATSGNTDVACFDISIAADQLWFRHVGNNLEVSVIGTSDSFTVSNWYLGSQYHVEQFKTSDGKTLLDSQVQNLVNAMASFTPPPAGQTTLPQNYATTLEPVIAVNWQ